MSIPRLFLISLLGGSVALLAGASCATRVGVGVMAASAAANPNSPAAPVSWPTQTFESSSSKRPDAGPMDASNHERHRHPHDHGGGHGR